MENKATFRVLKNELLVVLKQLQKLEKTVRKKLSTIEVTIIDDHIQMAIPGVQLQINAATKGSAKFTVRLWYLADIIKAEKDASLDFELLDNQLKLRVFTFPVLTTFFETDRILRTINLPVNYTDMDLVKLCLSGKFTDEEISFNKLDKIATEAMQKTKADISKIFFLMKKYGFNKKEIEELILNKLKDDMM